MELVCPAGNLLGLKAAVNNGANAVYLGLKDSTNARHFAGLNFTEQQILKGIDYAHQKGCKVFIAINTYAQAGRFKTWQRAVDIAAELNVDAIILADIGLLDYATNKHPNLTRHLSVQGSATSYPSLNFYHQEFGIKRAVLPRVLSLKQVQNLAVKSPVELEVFAFGSLCIMAEGRCHLSSYLTGESPNTVGACSPAKFVEWKETDGKLETRLNNVLIDRFEPDEKAGYPTLCKGRFNVDGNRFHALEEPTSLNTLDVLPQLKQAGVVAVKIEGRQRGVAYTEQVTSVWRKALDQLEKCNDDKDFSLQPDWNEKLASLSEGSQTTLGAYHRPWQ